MSFVDVNPSFGYFGGEIAERLGDLEDEEEMVADACRALREAAMIVYQRRDFEMREKIVEIVEEVREDAEKVDLAHPADLVPKVESLVKRRALYYRTTCQDLLKRIKERHD